MKGNLPIPTLVLSQFLNAVSPLTNGKLKSPSQVSRSTITLSQEHRRDPSHRIDRVHQPRPYTPRTKQNTNTVLLARSPTPPPLSANEEIAFRLKQDSTLGRVRSCQTAARIGVGARPRLSSYEGLAQNLNTGGHAERQERGSVLLVGRLVVSIESRTSSTLSRLEKRHP